MTLLKPKFNMHFLLAIFAFGLMACSAPKEDKGVAAEKAPLIPEGFEVLATDTIIIANETFVINALKHVAEDSLSENNHETARPLTILNGDKKSGFELVARNDDIILCQLCGGMMGDPWDGIYIEENRFTINHAGGSSYRWTRNVTFQYDEVRKEWLLTTDKGASFSSLDPENTFEETIYTPVDSLGSITFERFKTEF